MLLQAPEQGRRSDPARQRMQGLIASLLLRRMSRLLLTQYAQSIPLAGPNLQRLLSHPARLADLRRSFLLCWKTHFSRRCDTLHIKA